MRGFVHNGSLLQTLEAVHETLLAKLVAFSGAWILHKAQSNIGGSFVHIA